MAKNKAPKKGNKKLFSFYISPELLAWFSSYCDRKETYKAVMIRGWILEEKRKAEKQDNER